LAWTRVLANRYNVSYSWRVTLDYNTNKINQTVLALLSLTLHDVDEFGGQAWKGQDWKE